MFEHFFICSNDLLIRPNESFICSTDSFICSNETFICSNVLLIRPNESFICLNESFFRPNEEFLFYLASLRRRKCYTSFNRTTFVKHSQSPSHLLEAHFFCRRSYFLFITITPFLCTLTNIKLILWLVSILIWFKQYLSQSLFVPAIKSNPPSMHHWPLQCPRKLVLIALTANHVTSKNSHFSKFFLEILKNLNVINHCNWDFRTFVKSRDLLEVYEFKGELSW